MAVADHLALFRNEGGGALALRQMVPVGYTPRSLVVRDLDGDQRLDIAVDYDATMDVMTGESAIAVFLTHRDHRIQRRAGQRINTAAPGSTISPSSNAAW